jgi:agmatine deiminase
MIPDWDTNHLFLSDLLEKKYPDVFAGLRSVLKDVPIEVIPCTADIWCRDFMPVQIDEDTFCKFVYAPDYLRGYEHLITPPEQCRLPFMKNYRQEPIVLDGGNVVASRNKVILTDKIYKENPSVERSRLLQRLEEVFQAKCIIIPADEPVVGHADGMVRFIDKDRVLVNDYSRIDAGSYGRELRNLLEKNGLEVELLPIFEEKVRLRPGEFPPAVGLYINFLRVGEFVVLPAYGRLEDHEAMEKMQRVLPNIVVSQVPCRDLAEDGGVLNCISWTIA